MEDHRGTLEASGLAVVLGRRRDIAFHITLRSRRGARSATLIITILGNNNATGAAVIDRTTTVAGARIYVTAAIRNAMATIAMAGKQPTTMAAMATEQAAATAVAGMPATITESATTVTANVTVATMATMARNRLLPATDQRDANDR